MLVVEAQFFFGDLEVDRARTSPTPVAPEMSWKIPHILEFPKVRVQNISPGSRLCFTILLLVGEKKTPLFWGNMQLISHDSKTGRWSLRTGTESLLMWPENPKGEFNMYKSIGICSENVFGRKNCAPQLSVQFPTYSHDVYIPLASQDKSHDEVLKRLKDATNKNIKSDLFHLKEWLKVRREGKRKKAIKEGKEKRKKGGSSLAHSLLSFNRNRVLRSLS